MEKMKLGQLLMALGRGQEYGENFRIQVVMSGDDWDDPVEARVDSDVFGPFLEFVVDEMGYEESLSNAGVSLIRVAISSRNGDR